uniref:uncharacterized protein K02A2.6-like n=1 Tax=Anopheles coluzzii TaxID=1518534 RepID=UPI0020FF9B9F|nr:uncharacterized protein K02A2.6-like [Anopheles coluzzii]
MGQLLCSLFVNKKKKKKKKGCILFGERLVIPADLRTQCLEQLHRGHPGIQRMKSLARSYVYWPLMDNEIVQYVATCELCAAAAKSPPQAIPAPWPKPSGPWQRLHVDYAGPIQDAYFLVVVDAFSKWPEIIKTSTTTTRATVAILRGLFARFGMPLTIVSDNGPQFTSDAFKEFCESRGIQHITTPPFHPQSNGQAERFVDTLKRALRKIQTGDMSIDEALDTFLQSYRTTPNPALEGNETPGELMVKFPVRTHLDLLRPPTVIERETNIVYGGFMPGDAVLTKVYGRNSWRWISAEVISKLGNVMYQLKGSDGRMLRRHQNQMRKRASKDIPLLPIEGSILQPGSESIQLPIDVILDEWKLPLVSDELPLTDTSGGSCSDLLPQPLSPERTAPPETITTMLRSPRRSSRNRRPPRWFDAFVF